jgi:hypothetical protein
MTESSWRGGPCESGCDRGAKLTRPDATLAGTASATAPRSSPDIGAAVRLSTSRRSCVAWSSMKNAELVS